ncbi:HD domain-containing protein [bacterium]|nr:HD domain-containing protein [bacterium]
MTKSPMTIINLQDGIIIHPEHYLYFYVAGATVKTGKNGGKYIDLQLFDGISTINGKVWNATVSDQDSFVAGSVIHITDGKVQSFQGTLQMVVQDADNVTASEIDNCCPGILPESHLSEVELLERWNALKEKIQDERYRTIINAFEEDKSVWNRFRMIPAGKSMHHAFRRGLLEHTITLAENAYLTAQHYRSLYAVNADLVIAGALLHDVGKEAEFIVTSSMASVQRYSDPGKLLGHIYMGAAYLQQLFNTVLPNEHSLHTELLHIILSHHGSYEFGSPKLPMTMEAMIVAAADNLDAHLSAVQNAFDAELDDRWTHKVFALQRNFYYSDYMKQQGEDSHE